MMTATRLFASAMLSTMRMLEENRRVLFCAKDTAKALGAADCTGQEKLDTNV